jgi:hypothetical protein
MNKLALNLAKPALLAFIFSSIDGCSSTSSSAAFNNSDKLIVPGERIGPIVLGMSDQALFKLDVPYTGRQIGSTIWYFFSGLKVLVDQNKHRVVCVELHGDNSYHTASGLRIGSRLVDIERAMGPPEQITENPVFHRTLNVKYQNNTVSFNFGPYSGSYADSPLDTVQSILLQVPGEQRF